MNIVNLTPHDVVLLDAVGQPLLTFAKSSNVARVDLQRQATPISLDVTDGLTLTLPIDTITSADVSGVPAPDGKTVYIVSRLVAERLRRPDVIAPDVKTAETIEGRVTGVYRFLSYSDAI